MLKLRGTFSQNPRLAPLLDGTIKPEGIEIEFEMGQPNELHERHLRDDAYDIFEFSISHFMMTKEHPSPTGRWDWVGLPIFLSKALMTMNTLVNVASGVEHPRDLKGKRFGIPDFSMTAGLWWRAMLRALYGYHAWDTSWVVGRTFEHSHAALIGVTGVSPRIPIEWPDRRGVLNEMLQSGAIDAAYPAGAEVALDADTGKVKRMFNDGGMSYIGDFVDKTGYAPVNHTVVVQRRVLDENPWAAEALYDAFERSKQEAYRRDPSSRVLFPEQPLVGQTDRFGDDPFVSGMAANREMLTYACEQSVEEGLAAAMIDIDGLFAEALRGT